MDNIQKENFYNKVIELFQNAKKKIISCSKYDGDFVIMISDGIVESLQCDDKEKEMANVIMDIESNNPKEMALIIMNEAIKLSGGVPKDDMTVLVTGIWRKH